MKRVLFDTDIILDVLLDRHPHVRASAGVWAAVERGTPAGMVAAHAVTTIHYLLRKEIGNVKAKQVVAALLRVFQVAAVDGLVIQDALLSGSSDFEDAVAAAAAFAAGCDCIVTRDPKGFRGSAVRCLTPEELAARLNLP